MTPTQINAERERSRQRREERDRARPPAAAPRELSPEEVPGLRWTDAHGAPRVPGNRTRDGQPRQLRRRHFALLGMEGA